MFKGDRPTHPPLPEDSHNLQHPEHGRDLKESLTKASPQQPSHLATKFPGNAWQNSLTRTSAGN